MAEERPTTVRIEAGGQGIVASARFEPSASRTGQTVFARPSSGEGSQNGPEVGVSRDTGTNAGRCTVAHVPRRPPDPCPRVDHRAIPRAWVASPSRSGRGCARHAMWHRRAVAGRSKLPLRISCARGTGRRVEAPSGCTTHLRSRRGVATAGVSMSLVERRTRARSQTATSSSSYRIRFPIFL